MVPRWASTPDRRFFQIRHARAQLRADAAAFFFAHLIEPGKRFFHSRHHRGLQFVSRFLGSRIHRARHPQNHVQIGLALNPKFIGRRAERLHVAGNQLPVERDPVRARAIQAKDHFHVAASQFLFQHPAQLHLQRVGIGGQPEVKIQKTMVHRFQR